MPNSTVAAIITAQRCGKLEILLTLRGTSPFKHRWCLPGGHIDQYEDARSAIIREVKEETNLDFNAQFFNYFDEIIPPHKIHAVVLVFEGDATGSLKARDGEISDIKWFPLEKARRMPLAFNHNHILDFYAARTPPLPSTAGLLEEYSALRDEINTRTQSRDRLLTFAIATAATFVGLAVQFNVEPSFLLLYPIVATFLAVLWTQGDVRVGQLGEYIRTNVESRFDAMGWQKHLRQEYAKDENRILRRLAEFSAGGIFVTTQLLAILLAAFEPKFMFSKPVLILLTLNFFGILLTLYLISLRRARYRKT